MELLKEVGAFAGLAAFLGLALLALLYFAQARDVRRLRENASFLVEGEGDGPAVAPADRAAAAAAVVAEEPERAAAAAAATAPDDREAFRRAELARQAAERRKRFEQRRRPGQRGPSFGGPGRPAWLSEGRSTIVIVVGAVLLLAGIAFGATQLIGGGGGGGTAEKGGKPAKAPPTQVAVLNATAEPGLAATFAAKLKPTGFIVKPVTNTAVPLDTSVVMFEPGAETAARQIASSVGISDVQPISQEVQADAAGAVVAVVLGDDQATGATTSSDTAGTDTTSGASGF